MQIDPIQEKVRSSGILLLLGGILHIGFGVQLLMLPVGLAQTIFVLLAISLILFGTLSVAASYALWHRKPWAIKLATGCGILVCSIDFFMMYLTIGIIAAVIYWFALSLLRNEHVRQQLN